MASNDIVIRVLGDHGPFSTMGKSIGYQVTIGATSFLVDCGSPLFQQIGGHGLKSITGLIITHCHDDHKRWFTDLALFNRYAPDVQRKVALFTSERINAELAVSSGPALNSSLSFDGKTVIPLAYDDYVDFNILGPRARYRIVSTHDGKGVYTLQVVDREGLPLGPDRAKILISPHNGNPRLLFKDPHYGEWVEPECFYPFSSDTFYEPQNVYRDPEGFTIEAINAPVWHGLPSIGLRFRTATETLVFSGDTAHDTELWQQLHTEKRPQRLGCSPEEFAEAAIIIGDINDYIERVWSSERYHEAMNSFVDAAVIHDIAAFKSVVHTDYPRLCHTVLHKDRTVLTHSPDKITSAWVMSKADRTFLVRGGAFHEVVDGRVLPIDADIYHKEGGKFFVGYRNEAGATTVFDNNGLLNLGGQWNWENGTPLFNVDLYEDVAGMYFPRLTDGSLYRQRPDGRVELVTSTDEGSHGVIVQDQREFLSRRNS